MATPPQGPAQQPFAQQGVGQIYVDLAPRADNAQVAANLFGAPTAAGPQNPPNFGGNIQQLGQFQQVNQVQQFGPVQGSQVGDISGQQFLQVHHLGLNQAQQYGVAPNFRLKDSIVLYLAMAPQLNYQNFIAFPTAVFLGLTQEDIGDIIFHYEHHIQNHAMIVKDATSEQHLLGPKYFFNTQNVLYSPGQYPVLLPAAFTTPIVQSPTPVATPTASSTDLITDDDDDTAKSGKAKIPRPPNAFILYRKENHPCIVANNKNIHNNAVSVIIGKMWQAEPLSVREMYKAKSEQLKIEHLEKYPGYTYQPRKPSEKKRRNTKNKIVKSMKRNMTASQTVATKYARVAQETGRLGGTLLGSRTATLPLSAKTTEDIEFHNGIHNDPNAHVVSHIAPVNVEPSNHHTSAVEANGLALDLALDPQSLSDGLSVGDYDPLRMFDEYEFNTDDWTF